MVAYNFQAQFAPLVESGKKTQTIRRDSRKRHARPGEPVQLYTGQRTPQCRKLIDPDPICVRVRAIEIAMGIVSLDGRSLDDEQIGLLAWRDGFQDAAQFFSFFVQRDNPVFVGSMIEWKLKEID